MGGDRDFHVVVFGATGFVGRLVASYLARHAPGGLRIGFAGRSEARLAAVRTAAAASTWPLVLADSTDAASLARLANAAHVVVSTVGPYRRHGLALVEACAARQKRTTRLRDQYGPEYDRALDQADSQREAESELRDRAKRHEKLELRSLDSSEREDFERRWSEVQGQFVDDPSNAVRNADLLVVEVMGARGYPVEDFDQRADDLSVSHPEVTQRYREARRIAQANKDGNADTEDLRQAVTSYRSLVMALLDDDGDRSQHNGTQSEHDNSHMTERETKA